MDEINRRAFQVTIAGGSVLGGASLLQASERDYPAPKFNFQRKKPSLPTQLVEDFVLFAHYDLDMVRKLLEKEPALGAASHLGQHEIIEFLLSKGARLDIFAATALGLLDVVKGMLAVQPTLIDIKGPHGFTLYAHARFGKERAAKVLEYLNSVKPEPQPPAKKPIEKKD
jgi:hypothetical protein